MVHGCRHAKQCDEWGIYKTDIRSRENVLTCDVLAQISGHLSCDVSDQPQQSLYAGDLFATVSDGNKMHDICVFG
jgi:hypothetical protein